MAAKSTTPSVKLPGITNRGQAGDGLAVFEKGSELFEKVTPGGPIDLVFEGGETVPGVVQSAYVGALVDLIQNYGQNNFYTYAEPYTLRGLISRIGQGEVVDVTKLYTVVLVRVDYPTTNTATSATRPYPNA